MPDEPGLGDTLSGLALFADLSRPQIEAVAHTFEEEWFDDQQPVVRQGFSGTGFYVIVEGQATVHIDGQDWSTMGKGDFFGEISALLQESPTADVIAKGPLRCLVLPAAGVRDFLIAYPQVMYRMLETQARRIRNHSQWQN